MDITTGVSRSLSQVRSRQHGEQQGHKTASIVMDAVYNGLEAQPWRRLGILTIQCKEEG